VYLALNATTGEMIAVKQVEIPRTASDKNDSRQVSVVQALKSESETLKDLDHPNIVQYLGFEETPNFLSMYVFPLDWAYYSITYFCIAKIFGICSRWFHRKLFTQTW
jgi:serine/threonine protein kinase